MFLLEYLKKYMQREQHETGKLERLQPVLVKKSIFQFKHLMSIQWHMVLIKNITLIVLVFL